MSFEKHLPFLRDGELPGPTSWNDLMMFLRRIVSRSPRLILNERPGGGIYIDLADADQAASAVRLSLWLSLDEELATWSLSAGSIRIAPSTVVSVAAASGQVTASTYVWIEWNASTATVQTGGSLPNLVNMTNRVCRTPIGRIDVSDGVMTLTHLHPGGDICVYDRPWILINGYANDAAAFRETAATGEETYITPRLCPTNDESDSTEA